jgi:hypothetical protein
VATIQRNIEKDKPTPFRKSTQIAQLSYGKSIDILSAGIDNNELEEYIDKLLYCSYY